MPKQNPVRAYLKETVRTQLREAEQQVALFERMLDTFAGIRSERLTYKVVLTHLWADEGGKGVTHEAKGSLADIMAAAIAEFRRVNNCTDLQANVYVYVALPGFLDHFFTVPEQYWREYKK
jgi:hypothetical protein